MNLNYDDLTNRFDTALDAWMFDNGIDLDDDVKDRAIDAAVTAFRDAVNDSEE